MGAQLTPAKAQLDDGKAVNSLVGQLSESLRKRDFWAYSSWLDIVTRYRRTRLGLLWLLAPMIMFMGLIGPMFSQLFGRPMGVFLPHLGLGVAIWRMLLMVINDSTSIFRSNKSFILDINARLTDFTLRSLAKALFYFAFAMMVVIPVLVWSPEIPTLNILTLAVTLPIVVINVFWLAYVISIIGARFPDFGHMVSTVLMAGFLFTPIIWMGDRFPADSLGGIVVRINPAYHLLELVRALVFGRWPEYHSLIYIVAMTIVGWGVAEWLSRRYARFVPIWI